MNNPSPQNLPVLIVDDDKELLQLLSTEIQTLAPVKCFENPLWALAYLQEQDFSVVISDLNMPEMNGLEFLSQCALLRPQAQRILLTGHADLADRFELINRAKLNWILAKPWEASEMKSILQSALQSSRIQHENEELRRIALTDSLTGISNRRYFWERLEAEFSRAKRFQRPLSLILCDIDDFKKFNDTYGHPKGDCILRDVAQCLEKNRRSMDNVARYGGEEFVIILPEVNSHQAYDIAQRYLVSIQKTTGILLSFGVASYPENAQSSTELLDQADQALLKAKNKGKGQAIMASELKKK